MAKYLVAKYLVNAYRVREVTHDIGFTEILIENGPDGSDDVTLPPGTKVEIGDYWVDPFGDGHIVARYVFERIYHLQDEL